MARQHSAGDRARPGAGGKAGKGRSGKRGTQRRSSRGSARGWWWAALGAALLVLALRAFPGAASGESGAPRVGGAAPSLKVKTLDGDRIALADLKGKVVLVNFWATWCPPCRAEMPGFEQVWRERQRDGFVVLGLSADEGGSGEVAAFAGERGITYPVAMASAGAKRAFGGVNALPQSFLIDRHGVVRRIATGYFDEHLLRQDVNRLLAER